MSPRDPGFQLLQQQFMRPSRKFSIHEYGYALPAFALTHAQHPQRSSSRWRLAVGLLLPALLLVACSANPVATTSMDPGVESTPDQVAELINQALDSRGDERAALTLQALAAMEESGPVDLTRLQLSQFNPRTIGDTTLRARIQLLSAEDLLLRNQPEQALESLQELESAPQRLSPEQRVQLNEMVGEALLALGRPDDALAAFLQANTAGASSQAARDRIWNSLQQLDNQQLDQLAESASSYELRGWIELARVYKTEQLSIRSQLNAITQWQRIWAQHSAASALPSALLELESAWQQRPQRIALLLPLQQPAGIAIQEGFLGAYYQALGVTREVPELTVYDTSDAVDIFPVYDQAVDAGADLVIGPLNKEFVNRLHQRDSLPVPTLALNYADNTSPGPGNLFQFGLAPEDEISQAISTAWQQGYRNAALLTPDNLDYQRLQSFFSQSWQNLGGNLVSRASFSGDGDYADVVKRILAIDSSEARAERLLSILPRANMIFTPRRREDIDFIFLMANPRQGRQIKPTLSFYFAEDVPVFSLPSINDGLNNQGANGDLNGIVFTDAPWLLSEPNPLKRALTENLRPAQGPLQRLRALGVDSYRLYARLQQMQQQQLQTLQGATGVLSMSSNQRIHRQLQLARFDNGIASPLRLNNSPGD